MSSVGGGGGSASWLPVYPNFGALPTPPNPGFGSVAIVLVPGAPDQMYEYDQDTGWTVIASGGGGGSPTGPASGELYNAYPNPSVIHRFMSRWSWSAQIPGPVVLQELRPAANIVAGTCGEMFGAAAHLKGISVVVDVAESAPNSWSIEVVKDPAVTPAVIGSALAVPNDGSTRTASRRDLDAALALGEEYGVRLVRVGGANASSFTDLVVTVEFSLP